MPLSLSQKIVLSAFFLFSSVTFCVDYTPWYGEVKEIDLNASVVVEAYHAFSTDARDIRRSTRDAFYALGASMAWSEELALQLEMSVSEVHHHQFGVDAIFLTGSKRWLNDIVGDFASISTGITLSQVFHSGLHNISAFYSGGAQAEFNVSIGREFSSLQFWTSRVFSVIGCGIADHGSPWLRANFVWENNWWDKQQAGIFLNTLWGLGKNSLNPNHFDSYGSIHHQSMDVGFKYRYALEKGIGLSLAYSYRVFAKNCPKSASFVTFNCDYAFGL